MDITRKPTTGNGSNLVHRPLVTCSTTVPSFIPLRRREPLQPTDGPTDGHSLLHATENDQMDITRKPTTGNGSNLVHRPLVTCSTTVPSFIPLRRREPLQPTDGPTDGHSLSHATENDQMNLTRKPTTGNGSNLVHRPLVTCSTTVPSFIPLRRREPLQPTDGPTDGHSLSHATENDQMNLTRKPTTGNGSNLVHRPLVTCSTTVPSFIPLRRREPLQPTDGHGRVHATEKHKTAIANKRTTGNGSNLVHRPLMSCSTTVPSFILLLPPVL